MRALTLLEHGGQDRLRVEELPTPAVERPDQVRIAVKAAALNHLDLFVLDGLPGVTLTFPHIVGTDAAGVVDAVGAEVTAVAPGDRVVVNPGISCGLCPMCQGGQDPLCRAFGVMGEHRPGTVAEYLVVPARNVAKVGDHLSWAEAAALPLATVTAWRMLTTRAKLTAGETALIWGIGGGVSLAALQIAKYLGARVIATSSSPEKLARATALGADLTLNHGTQDVAKEARALTKVGVDVVVDSVGEKTWEKSLRALRPGGRLVTCGATTGPHVQLDLRRLFWFQWSLLGSTMGSVPEFAAMMEVANSGKLTPVVDLVVPLDRAIEAYERLASGAQLGKVVIEVGR
jgi:NADPH:quinone reductase-like Zn-dependent oxidoreductase